MSEERRYSIDELLECVKEFEETHPHKKESEYFGPINQMEAWCAQQFLLWLHNGKVFENEL